MGCGNDGICCTEKPVDYFVQFIFAGVTEEAISLRMSGSDQRKDY